MRCRGAAELASSGDAGIAALPPAVPALAAAGPGTTPDGSGDGDGLDGTAGAHTAAGGGCNAQRSRRAAVQSICPAEILISARESASSRARCSAKLLLPPFVSASAVALAAPPPSACSGWPDAISESMRPEASAACNSTARASIRSPSPARRKRRSEASHGSSLHSRLK
eukprot:scaffold26288_cov111-Isochrysis_galbana.AAC.2